MPLLGSVAAGHRTIRFLLYIGSNKFAAFGVTDVSKSKCIFELLGVNMSPCVTVRHILWCNTCDKCLIYHKYQCHESLVIKCVVGGLFVTGFNKVWGAGQKVILRPSATTSSSAEGKQWLVKTAKMLSKQDTQSFRRSGLCLGKEPRLFVCVWNMWSKTTVLHVRNVQGRGKCRVSFCF
jgi:hypothetical protein